MDKLDIKLVRKGAQVPSRATDGSAGYDLRACIDEPVTIKAHSRALIPSGVAIALGGSGYVAVVCARSGLAIKRGISLSNGVGIIDSDYRGEICVGLVNLSDEDYTIEPGERIAQLLIMPVFTPKLCVCDELDESERGAGGFGSTGKK